MKRILYGSIAALLLTLGFATFHLNSEIRTLAKKNEALSERMRFEQCDDLEIMPCRLCGKEATLRRTSGVNCKYYVRCDHCGYETYAYEKVQEALDFWNEK